MAVQHDPKSNTFLAVSYEHAVNSVLLVIVALAQMLGTLFVKLKVLVETVSALNLISMCIPVSNIGCNLFLILTFILDCTHVFFLYW